MPVYNEQDINFFIQSLITNGFLEDNELIIIDGNNGSTIKNITIKNRQNIKTYISTKGRAHQMNEGVKKAQFDIIIFLHADTLLPNNAMSVIKNTLQKDIVAGAFDLSFDSQSLLLSFIAKISSYRSRLTRQPYGDQAIFIKKDIFNKIGCYENIALMEDVNLMQKLKKQNYKIKISKEKVVTSARKWEDKGIIYTTLRNWILITLYYIGTNPNKLSKYYK